VLSIKLPPLRERNEDIPSLCEHFIGRFRESLGKDIKEISSAAMSQLLSYHWPGNVRELENAIERALVLAEDSVLLPENFPPEFSQSPKTDHANGLIEGFSLKQAQRVLEKKLITKALKETGGNRTQAARLLEISHPSLLTKIKAYDIPL
jgi:two-component system response regulator AtoC